MNLLGLRVDLCLHGGHLLGILICELLELRFHTLVASHQLLDLRSCRERRPAPSAVEQEAWPEPLFGCAVLLVANVIVIASRWP